MQYHPRGNQRPKDKPYDFRCGSGGSPGPETCRAYISVLGDEESQANTLAGLKSAEGYIRSKLAKNINLRNTPQIRFVLDQSIEYGVTMSKKIDEVNQSSGAEEQG